MPFGGRGRETRAQLRRAGSGDPRPAAAGGVGDQRPTGRPAPIGVGGCGVRRPAHSAGCGTAPDGGPGGQNCAQNLRRLSD